MRNTLKRTRKVLRAVERLGPAGEALARKLFHAMVTLGTARQIRSGILRTRSSFIAITTQVGCRCACEFCPQDLLVKAYARRTAQEQPAVSGVEIDRQCMTLESFHWFMERIPPEVAINFAGFSEPWLTPHCPEMILAAHERGHRLRLFTTLVGMSPAQLARLSRIPFLNFRVHVPGSGNGSPIRVDDQVLETLRAIVDQGVSNLMYHHHGDQPHPAFVERLGRFQINHEVSHYRAGNLDQPGLARVERRHRGPIRCGHDPRFPELDHNILLPNGDLALCCMDWGLDHVIGNLARTDLETIYRSEPYLTLKRGLDDDSLDSLCRYCTLAVPQDSASGPAGPGRR